MKSSRNRLIRSVVLSVAAALYLVSPIDIIPDALFGFGQMDDLAVAILAITEGVCAWKLYTQSRAQAAAEKQAQTAETSAAASIEAQDVEVHDEY